MMKTKILKMILIGLLSIFSIHSKASCDEEISFKENYSKNFQKDKVFFIKGVALEVYEYGRTIKVVEDLKGNFYDEPFIFVWGGGFPSEGSGFIGIETNRSDVITWHQENDTLIMLLGRPIVFEEGIETSGDYATMECTFSVLKLSNGFVTGCISPPFTTYQCMDVTMPWEELQMLLTTNVIQSTYVKNNVYQQNGTIFFENPEGKTVKLLFYDLSGKLVHEITTTSNSYRPALAGSIFVCKIKMNDEVVTIKYVAP